MWGGNIWAPGARNDIENAAFSAYCLHDTEMENIITELVRGGDATATVYTGEFFTATEWEKIRKEAQYRIDNGY